MFEPFYSTKTAKGGTGLGLAIARDIIQAHGGTLTVTSAGERGARFTVSLPAAASGVQPYRLHWMSAADGRLSLDGLNALVLA